MLMFNEYLLTSAHDSLVNAGTWWMRALVKVNWLDYNHLRSGRGSARLERTVRVREVPSSNLGAPTNHLPCKISPGSSRGGFY